MTYNNSQYLKKLISKNRIKEVIKFLVENKEIFLGDKQNQIILLSNQYSQYESKQYLGLEDLDHHRNKIVASLLSLVDQLHEDNFDKNEFYIAVNNHRRTKVNKTIFWFFGIPVTITLCLYLFIGLSIVQLIIIAILAAILVSYILFSD